jgi:MFS family permease
VGGQAAPVRTGRFERFAASPSLRAFSHRNFRIFFVSQSVSFIGTWMQLTAQTLLIYDLTGTGTSIGLLTACQFAPTLLLGAWAGVVIDRSDTRRLMAASSGVMMFTALAMGALVVTGQITPLMVYGLAMLLGVANTFDNPGRRTLVNELVPHEDIGNAVSLNSTMVMGMRVIGPALAGLLIATVGIGWCFLANGASFVVAIGGLRRMDRETLRARLPVARGPGQVRAGVRYAWSHRPLREALLLLLGLGLIALNFQVLLALYVKVGLGGSDSMYAVTSALAGGGAMVAGLVLASHSRFDSSLLGRMALLYALSLAGLAVAPSLWWAAVPIIFAGFAQLGFLSGANTVLQIESSPEMRGRVIALYTLVTLGTNPPSGALTGWTTDLFGAPSTVAYCAVSAALVGGLTLRMARRAAVSP